jgi:hypothetical protein
MTPRLSKSIDMRFHWLQDRIQRRQFRVEHVTGDYNIAEVFTKALPRIKHAQFVDTSASIEYINRFKIKIEIKVGKKGEGGGGAR